MKLKSFFSTNSLTLILAGCSFAQSQPDLNEGLTRLEWQHEGQHYVAWSNIDLKKDKPKYVVITSGRSKKRQKDARIPIDALHKYYAKNEKRLKVQHQRNEALNNARKRYKNKNPEEPDDIFINFWPVRSGIHQEPSDKI